MAVLSGRTGQLGGFGYGPDFLLGQVPDREDQFGKLGLADLAQEIGLVFHVVGSRAQKNGLSIALGLDGSVSLAAVSYDANPFLEPVGTPFYLRVSFVRGRVGRGRQDVDVLVPVMPKRAFTEVDALISIATLCSLAQAKTSS